MTYRYSTGNSKAHENQIHFLFSLINFSCKSLSYVFTFGLILKNKKWREEIIIKMRKRSNCFVDFLTLGFRELKLLGLRKRKTWLIIAASGSRPCPYDRKTVQKENDRWIQEGSAEMKPVLLSSILLFKVNYWIIVCVQLTFIGNIQISVF